VLDAFLLGRDGGQPAQHPFFEGLDLPAQRPLLGAVRVLRSDDDPIVPARLSDEVADALGVRAEVVAGAGHFLASDGLEELPTLLERATPSSVGDKG
jgi:predicted alpha/beta hydrolase family esterase